MKDVLCDPPVWESPLILLNSLDYTWSSRKSGVCRSELLNTFISWGVVSIVVGVTLSLVYENWLLLLVSILLAILIVSPAILAFKNSVVQLPVERTTEAFSTLDVAEKAATVETYPTSRNPFMNILLDEIKYNPTRPPAGDVQNPIISKTLDDFFRVQFTSDPTDVFGRSQSQRQFITMPSTTIPNDVDTYQNWLYKIPGKTCKEGGREACLPGTDGGQLPWLNVEK